MSEREPVTLEFLARQQDRMLAELASLRDDVNVLTAIIQRLDNSHTRLLAEIRATHSQVSRQGERLRRLESPIDTGRRAMTPRRANRGYRPACSAFTRVAACTLALSPIRDTLIEGFSHFVTSMTAPIASGWSESPGGACTHWKAPPCHGTPVAVIEEATRREGAATALKYSVGHPLR